MSCEGCPQLRHFIRPDGTICPNIKMYGVCGFHFDRPDQGGPPCPYEELEKILYQKRWDDDFLEFVENAIPAMIEVAKGTSCKTAEN